MRPSAPVTDGCTGWQVTGDSAFDLTIDIVAGDSIQVGDVPTDANVGVPTEIEVCADTTTFEEGETGPLSGIVAFGPAGAPSLIQIPVTWLRVQPAIFMPIAAANAPLIPDEAPQGEPTEEPPAEP